MTTQPKPTFSTLDEIHAATRQTSAQEIINGRLCLNNGGWTDVEITPTLREQVVNEVVDIAGGRLSTRERIREHLTHENRQHWALSRMFVVKYEGPARLQYCAGQDYASEMAQLRAYLK